MKRYGSKYNLDESVHPPNERCRLVKRMWGSLGSLLYAPTMKDETSRSRERIDERIKS